MRMPANANIERFALFGEDDRQVLPEFVHIESISQRSRLYDWTITPHAHPGIFQILLLHAGSGILATDGLETRLHPGAMILLPAGCVHAFRFASDAEGAVLSIALDLFNDPRISALCARALQSGGTPRVAFLPLDSAAYFRLRWVLDDISTILAQDRSGRLPDSTAARIVLLLTLAEEACSTQQGEALSRRENPRERLADRFRNLVDAHFRENWTVADYARALGTTRPTLTRACRVTFGKAPAEIVHDRLLLEAMRGLTYSSATVSQIANDLGFTEPAYFARFFKGRTGMTASAFRTNRSWLSAGK